MWFLDRKSLADLRADPFYFFLLARTKHYDQIVQAAVADGIKHLVEIGCGTDTRAHRFERLLRSSSVRVLECDQPQAISIKKRLAQKLGRGEHIDYLPIDLDAPPSPDFRRWLGVPNVPKTLVMMEGVSPYVNHEAFSEFLRFLSATLPRGSSVAYDFKIRGIRDDFGQETGDARLFRLPNVRADVASFHRDRGLTLELMESGAELAARQLPGFHDLMTPPFSEDVVLHLRV